MELENLQADKQKVIESNSFVLSAKKLRSRNYVAFNALQVFKNKDLHPKLMILTLKYPWAALLTKLNIITY